MLSDNGKYISTLSCPLTYVDDKLFFSLVDYRNNLFTSNDPKKILEFYNGFENKEQLIRWMEERPKGITTIYEVDGDKNIIIVIPTSDYNGKYAKECKDNIYKGFHIIFVESGLREDFYFNYAHNCNVGVRKAMEYNPKWVVLSNDDMIKIDEPDILRRELSVIKPVEQIMVLSKNKSINANIAKLALSTIKRNLVYRFIISYGYDRIRLERKFHVKYLVAALNFPYNLLFRITISFPAVGDFAIFSFSILNDLQTLFDERFINGGEDIDLSILIHNRKYKCQYRNYKINSIGRATLGRSTERSLRDIINMAYLNKKIENIYHSM